MDPRIADYIRANRRRYTREAITKQLLEAGHDPAEIERTWAALDTRDADAVAGEGFWGRFALILIGINLGVLVLLGLLTGALQQAGQGGVILLVVLAVVLAIGALISWAIVAATGPTKLSPTTALVIGILVPLLFALLIGGACYALIGGLGGMGSPGPQHAGIVELRIADPFSFEGSGDALCHPAEGDAVGFSIYTEGVGMIERQRVTVSVDAYPHTPGEAARTVDLFVSLFDDRTGEGVGYHVGPGSDVNLDASESGLAGTVEFRDLEASPMEGPAPRQEDAEPISGSVTWNCE